MRGMRYILVLLVFVAVLLPGERVVARIPADCDGGALASIGFFVRCSQWRPRSRSNRDGALHLCSVPMGKLSIN